MKRNTRYLLSILLGGVFSFVLCFGGVCQAAASGQDDAEMRDPLPEQRLTLSERLVLQNAVCALWHEAALQKPESLQKLNPVTLTIPRDIFIEPLESFYYDGEAWIFEGLIRRMAVQADGLEGISDVQSFHMQARRQNDGSLRIVFIHFVPHGRG